MTVIFLLGWSRSILYLWWNNLYLTGPDKLQIAGLCQALNDILDCMTSKGVAIPVWICRFHVFGVSCKFMKLKLVVIMPLRSRWMFKNYFFFFILYSIIRFLCYIVWASAEALFCPILTVSPLLHQSSWNQTFFRKQWTQIPDLLCN